MTQKEIQTKWNYYLIIEDDLYKTTRFVEPSGQENVYSFEFEKIIILSCTEIEKIFKLIAYELKKEKVGSIDQYKSFMLKNYPKIIDTVVNVSRMNREIKPFENWDVQGLAWWEAYNSLKHDKRDGLKNATLINAIYSVGALYLLIMYLGRICNLEVYNNESRFIDSEYGYANVVVNNSKELPGF